MMTQKIKASMDSFSGFWMALCWMTFSFHSPVQASQTTGWEDLEMRAMSASGELRQLEHIQLRAMTTGYYEHLPVVLELSDHEPSEWNHIQPLKHYSLECNTYLSIGRVSNLKGFGTNIREDDELIVSLKSELYSRCDIPIVYPWNLKLVLKSKKGEILGQAEFRGQPHRIRSSRNLH